MGPIGIITAITTLIRLTGIRTLKRFIGRQYESFPEVLADVTSVSRGDVGVEIRNDRLEQTITPGKDDVAIFYLRARKEGGYKDLQQLTQKAMRRIEHDCVPPHGSIPPEWFAVVGLFQTKITMGNGDESAHAKSTVLEMRHLITDYLFERSLPRDDRGSRLEHITGFIEIFTGWEGISPSLTACFNGEQPLINGVRFMISLLCILGYIGVIIANWFVQNNPQNTVLVTVGLAVSTIGAYYTANMVNSQSTETRTNLDFIEGLRSVCGYYSSSGRYASFKSCPKSIISSTKTTYAGSARQLFPPGQDHNLSLSRAVWVARPTVVVVAMTLGYVGLYLGLRTAEWWASLSLLAISAVASITRVVFVNDDQELVWKSMSDNSPLERAHMVPGAELELCDRAPVGANFYTPWPWTSPARMAKANFMDCPPSVEGPTIASLTSTTDCKPATDDSTIHIHQQMLRPAIIPHQAYTYTILTAKCQQVSRVNVGREFQYDFLNQTFFANLMHGSLLVAKELCSRSLIPTELSSMAHMVDAPQPSRPREHSEKKRRQRQQRLDSTAVLLSDIIVQDGVWRQTLELVLNISHSTPEISLNECSVNLGFWWLHAQKLRDTASEINAIQISTDHSYYGGADSTYAQDIKDTGKRARRYIPGGDEDDRSYSAGYHEDHIPFRDYIWMGAKICFVLVKNDPRPEKMLQNLLHLLNDKNPNLNLQEDEAKSVVDCMENICLAVPANNV